MLTFEVSKELTTLYQLSHPSSVPAMPCDTRIAYAGFLVCNPIRIHGQGKKHSDMALVVVALYLA